MKTRELPKCQPCPFAWEIQDFYGWNPLTPSALASFQRASPESCPYTVSCSYWTPDSVTPSAEDRKDLHFSVYIIHLYGMRQHTFFAWAFQILNSEASSDLPRLYTMKIKMQYTNFAHFLYCKPFAILKFLSCAFDEYFLYTYDTDMIYIFFVATLISVNFNRKSISILVSWWVL